MSHVKCGVLQSFLFSSGSNTVLKLRKMRRGGRRIISHRERRATNRTHNETKTKNIDI
jgi:hypothetical protein